MSFAEFDYNLIFFSKKIDTYYYVLPYMGPLHSQKSETGYTYASGAV